MPSARVSLDVLLAGLNTAQREAVATTEGPLLVLAGAGTGKTRVITFRIAHLLLRGVQPENILGVTFTNKAAAEMRERVADLLGGRKPKGLTLSTFHALGVRILRADGEALGLREGFTIHDSSDQVAVLRTILRDIRGPVSAGDARAVLARISLAKNRLATPEDLVESAEDDHEYLIARTYSRYQEALLRANGVDFDDLILLPVRLLQENESIRERYQERFRYLMIDEYQDTNGAQYRFTQALVGTDRNICVVGDDDQSIYGFRGAEMDKILRFEKDFPGARVVKLEENYRSTAPILELANTVISANTERHAKRLRSTVAGGEPVRWVETPTGESEVDYVVFKIGELHRGSRAKHEDMAILLRSAIQARPFEEKLRLRQIPYHLIGGQSYFDRKEIRDTIAYCNATVNPHDDMSLLRILNTPKRGFGETTVRRLDALARERRQSLRASLSDVAAGEAGFSARAREGAGELVAALDAAQTGFAEGRLRVTVDRLLEDVRYREALEELYTDPLTLQARWGAVEDFLASIERFERGGSDRAFRSFLDAISLDSTNKKNRDDEERSRGVTIQTLHSAKGLEYPIVFLVGLEEELLPHKKSMQDGERAIEEERRLFYVGITRARRSLFMTTAATRRAYGKDQLRKPSRFLTEITRDDLWEAEIHRPSALASEVDVQGFLAAYRDMARRQDDD